MQFSTIFKHMKEDGIKAKLPSWGGYWEWDSEKETIMMHCNGVDSDTGKEVLDIREKRFNKHTYYLLHLLHTSHTTLHT